MFWKKKIPNSSTGAMDAIKKTADEVRKELKQPVKKRQPNPLWELVMKAQSHEELKELADTYQDSADIFFDLVLILRTHDLDLKVLDKNINFLDERVTALEEKTKKKKKEE